MSKCTRRSFLGSAAALATTLVPAVLRSEEAESRLPTTASSPLMKKQESERIHTPDVAIGLNAEKAFCLGRDVDMEYTYSLDGFNKFQGTLHFRMITGPYDQLKRLLGELSDITHHRNMYMVIRLFPDEARCFERPIITSIGSSVATANQQYDAYGLEGGGMIPLKPCDRMMICENVMMQFCSPPIRGEMSYANMVAVHPGRKQMSDRAAEYCQRKRKMTIEEVLEYNAQVAAKCDKNIDRSVWGRAGIDLKDPDTFPV